MSQKRFVIESKKPFAESLIWQLNRDFYNKKGIDAWSSGEVPHNMTSSSMVGKTYSELIYGFLKDLGQKGQLNERVYIVELGAGHGRLAFHILKHLGRMLKHSQIKTPPFCYVLTDIAEANLDFFSAHPQFQPFFESGKLDVAFFDAVNSESLSLRKSKLEISPKSLKQPVIGLANYFFDSIPTDAFHFNNTKVSECSVSIDSEKDPEGRDLFTIFKELDLTIHKTPVTTERYDDPILNEILAEYRTSVFNAYLFFPDTGIGCINRLKALSEKGLLLLTMDKGFHKIHDLENAKEPDMITHGSMSFWVNFHALSAYCEKTGGKAIFPSFSTFDLQLGCLFFLPEGDTYSETHTAYRRFVDDYGPDDFNGMKKFAYKHLAGMSLRDLIGVLRLGAYDSALFMNVLPRIKQVAGRITFNDRNRLAQTLHRAWSMYFSLYEKEDMAFEIGGMLYALGYYPEALTYFKSSVAVYGESTDEFYNRALCYYQMREDELFLKTIAGAKKAFPEYERFGELEKLDLGAA